MPTDCDAPPPAPLQCFIDDERERTASGNKGAHQQQVQQSPTEFQRRLLRTVQDLVVSAEVALFTQAHVARARR